MICNGKCEECILKLNREPDNESKHDLINTDKNIFYEKECIDKLGLGWCTQRFCNFDGYSDGILVDIKNKREENYIEYGHGLGLIIGSNEVMTMATFKRMLKLEVGAIIYYFKDGMRAVEIDMAMKYHTVAPINNHEVFYVPFHLWNPVGNIDDIIDLTKSKYKTHECLECKQESYDMFHEKCLIKRTKRKINALIDDGEWKWI